MISINQSPTQFEKQYPPVLIIVGKYESLKRPYLFRALEELKQEKAVMMSALGKISVKQLDHLSALFEYSFDTRVDFINHVRHR